MRIYAVILLLIMSSMVVRAGAPLLAAMMSCGSTCSIDSVASREDATTCSADTTMSCCGDSDAQESGCCTSGECDCTCCVHVVALTPLPYLDAAAEIVDAYPTTPAYECNYLHLRGSSTFHPPLV